MESLFGPEDGGEIAYRLSQRIAFFLESDRGSAQKTYALAKDCYKVRSKLVHGFRVARINDGDFVKYLTESETPAAQVTAQSTGDSIDYYEYGRKG